MKQEKIDRISVLSRKSRSVGLTEEEKAEQAALRREYLEAIKANMRAMLEGVTGVKH